MIPRISVWLSLFLALSVPTLAQHPEAAGIQGVLAPPDLQRGACNNAGTTNQTLSGGSQSNDPTFLCYGDSLLIMHNGDADLTGDPNPATMPGIGYAFYSCPPSIGGMDLATILTDPCIFDTPPSPTGIWIHTGIDPAGNTTFINDGTLQSFFNGGSPVQVWFAPITVDDFATNGYEETFPGSGAGPCVNVNVNAAFSVVYLNELTYSGLQITGPGVNPGGGSFVVTGGLPEFDGSNYTITITRKNNPGQTGTITSGPSKHGTTVTFTVPVSGVYIVSIADDTGCGRTFEIKVPGIVFTIDCKEVVEGGTVCLDVFVTNFTDVESFQFFFHFDASLLKFASISNVPLMNFDPVFSGVQNDSIFFMGYFSFPGETIPDGGLFATLCFEAIGPPGETSPITLAPGAIGQQLECYNGDGINLGVNFNPGCVSIIPGGAINLTFTVDSVGCAGDNDGAFQMQVKGGVEPFTYAWAHTTDPTYSGMGNLLFNPSTLNVPNLIGGVYSVTITDSNLPPSQEIKTILVPSPAPLNIQLDGTGPTCFGDADGSFFADVTGGTTPYLFQWSTGDQGTGLDQINNLGNQNYGVTVTDVHGCSETETGTLQTDSIIIALLSVQDETCLAGGHDGAITVAATGGTLLNGSNYAYDWGSAGTGPSLANLTAGFYTVSVTDDNQCLKTLTVEVTSPNAPVIDNILVTDAGCATKANGALEAQVTPSPGAPNLTFAWAGPNMTTFSGPVITGLVPGNYFVTVVDDNGCSDVGIAFVNAPFPLTVSDTILNLPDCPTSTNGSIGIQMVGGTMPYAFTWSNIGNPSPNSVNAPIPSGAYTVTITDAEGCGPLVLDLVLPMAPGIVASFSNLDSVSCQQGICDGGAQVTAQYDNGSAGAFNFSWSSGELTLGQAGSTANQLCAGIQQVTISDGLCSIDTTVTIPAPAPILVEVTASDARCAGQSDGELLVMANGGTPAYVYVWSPGDTSLSNLKTGLMPGTFTVTVVDQNGCLGESIPATVAEPLPFTASILATGTANERCAGVGDGQITVQTSGGNPGILTYQWSGNVSTSNIASGLGAGQYTITVTDPKGCQDTTAQILTSPPPVFAVIPQVEDPPCFGDPTFLTVSSATGGNGGPYTYSVDNGSPNALNSLVPAFAGQPVLVTVFDLQGCTWDTLLDINQPLPLTLDLGPDQDLELGDSLTLGPVNNLGGFTIVSYLWNPGEGLDCDVCSKVNAKPGKTTTYQLRIEDANGCAAEDEVTLRVRTIRRVYVPTAFSPNNDGFNDLFTVYTGQGVRSVDAIRIYDRWGDQVYELLDQPIAQDGTVLGWDGTLRGRPMDPGVYVFVVEVTFIDGTPLVYRGEVTVVK